MPLFFIFFLTNTSLHNIIFHAKINIHLENDYLKGGRELMKDFLKRIIIVVLFLIGVMVAFILANLYLQL